MGRIARRDRSVGGSFHGGEWRIDGLSEVPVSNGSEVEEKGGGNLKPGRGEVPLGAKRESSSAFQYFFS